jgi:unsaturated rhamnogalacturonyl hydrolase
LREDGVASKNQQLTYRRKERTTLMLNLNPPFIPRGFWMILVACAMAMSVSCAGLGGGRGGPALNVNPEEALSIMKRVADWQLAHPSQHPATHWTMGAFDAGVMALYDVSRDPKYLDAMLAMGQRNQWRPGTRLYHADDQTVMQTYLEMYAIRKEPAMLAPARERLDAVLAAPPSGAFDQPVDSVPWRDQWTWCDALFMAPPVWARMAMVTGERKYLDFMDAEWWKTYDHLYDPAEHLFYRDKSFIGKTGPSGKKVFWSRGNGWVMGGLARVLQTMPGDYPNRGRYMQLFCDMAAKLVTLQGMDGLWRTDLLGGGEGSVGETSGTGFDCYALAWGVNNGLLDRAKYTPAIERAWRGLCGCVQEDGMLGYVQQIGAGPATVSRANTEVYGSGAFLLAGSEVYHCARPGPAKSGR